WGLTSAASVEVRDEVRLEVSERARANANEDGADAESAKAFQCADGQPGDRCHFARPENTIPRHVNPLGTRQPSAQAPSRCHFRCQSADDDLVARRPATRARTAHWWTALLARQHPFAKSGAIGWKKRTSDGSDAGGGCCQPAGPRRGATERLRNGSRWP